MAGKVYGLDQRVEEVMWIVVDGRGDIRIGVDGRGGGGMRLDGRVEIAVANRGGIWI